METEVFADLIVSDFSMTHEEFTKSIGIEPTEAENVGDEVFNKKKNTSYILKYNSWTLTSQLDKHSSVNEHLKYLIDKVTLNKSNFVELTKDLEPTIKIVMNTEALRHDSYEIESVVLKTLGEMSISLVFSVYSVEST